MHCAAIGCYSDADLSALRKRAENIKGPGFEDWMRNLTRAGVANLSTGGECALL